MVDLKTQARDEIVRNLDSLRGLCRLLHEHPETAMQELQAQSWITRELQAHGFIIETGIAGLPTAFRAGFGRGQPCIAFLAEYDALPGLGHACGHNLIATAAVAAALGTKQAVDALGGTVMVIGTPAEEMGGGKIIMAARGAFANVDAAMMLHPSSYDTATIKALAAADLEVEFFGREAHAAAHPEKGINALEAMILSFNAVNSLRQHITERARIHGIITDGGKAANIVPGRSAGHFLVRSEDLGYLAELKDRVLRCFEGAAVATGCRLEYHWGDRTYAPMRNNLTLAGLYLNNMKRLGHDVPLLNPDLSFGSTDMGNVSQILPAIHPEVAIAPAGVNVHTSEFARLAGGEHGFEAMMLAAEGLAMTAIDLMAQLERLHDVQAEFAGHDSTAFG